MPRAIPQTPRRSRPVNRSCSRSSPPQEVRSWPASPASAIPPACRHSGPGRHPERPLRRRRWLLGRGAEQHRAARGRLAHPPCGGAAVARARRAGRRSRRPGPHAAGARGARLRGLALDRAVARRSTSPRCWRPVHQRPASTIRAATPRSTRCSRDGVADKESLA